MGRKLDRKAFERIKESKWWTSCISENQTFLILKSYSLCSKLASRTLFAVESTNSIKRKITHHRAIGDGCIWEGMRLINACRVSRINDSVFKRKYLMDNNVSFKKDTQKVILLQVKG